MNAFINEHGCLLISAGTLEELKALTKWVGEYKAHTNCAWISTENPGGGILYESLGWRREPMEWIVKELEGDPSERR
jgi:hypothetical protein